MNNDDDEIPTDIDFSSGTRGKYAQRYREGITVREYPLLDPIGLYETQSRVGYALLSAQALERALVAYISLVFDVSPVVAGRETVRILEEGSSSILDRLRADWAPYVAASMSLEDRLRSFLQERHWLVHLSWHELELDVQSQERRRKLATRLEALADEARYLHSKVDAVLERRLLERGLSASEIRARAQDVIDRWVAA